MSGHPQASTLPFVEESLKSSSIKYLIYFSLCLYHLFHLIQQQLTEMKWDPALQKAKMDVDIIKLLWLLHSGL